MVPRTVCCRALTCLSCLHVCSVSAVGAQLASYTGCGMHGCSSLAPGLVSTAERARCWQQPVAEKSRAKYGARERVPAAERRCNGVAASGAQGPARGKVVIGTVSSGESACDALARVGRRHPMGVAPQRAGACGGAARAHRWGGCCRVNGRAVRRGVRAHEGCGQRANEAAAE